MVKAAALNPKASRARAKALILTWYDRGNPTPERRKLFSSDVDRFFDTIELRNDWRERITTLLDDSGAATFSASGKGWHAHRTGKGLAVSSVVPGWGFGWQQVLQTEETDYILSWVGHYARQYVHRSNIAKVLMMAWERDGLLLHPFGSGVQMRRYSDRPRIPSDRAILGEAARANVATWGGAGSVCSQYRSAWIRRNTLDPAIHQGIFHFLRGQNLAASGFELEALVAFDCVLHSLQYMDWSESAGNPLRDRADLCRALGLSQAAIGVAENVYFMRNQFVAHAGGWRWWDAGEFLEGDLVSRASQMASRALRRAADLEPPKRIIDPTPSDWSSWLIKHFPIVWGAVWFR